MLSVCLSLCFTLVACGDDADLGTSRTDNSLRIGGDDPSLSLGTGSESGGGASGTRPIEESLVFGNIFNLRPATARPIFVFAFVNLRDQVNFLDFDDVEISRVHADQTFGVPNLASGDLSVVFLLDEAGVNQDGTINPGDPIAVFQDPNGTLRGLSAQTQVTLEDIDLEFDLDSPRDGIAQVQTEANIIVTQRRFDPADMS